MQPVLVGPRQNRQPRALPKPGGLGGRAGFLSRHSANEFPDINVNARAGGMLGGGEDLAADFFRDVGLAAIGAHFCGDSLEDQRPVVSCARRLGGLL